MNASQRDKLQLQLVTAHEIGDKHALVELYRQAAALRRDEDDTAGEKFYLTHAWVFALDAGASHEIEIYDRLKTLKSVD